MARNIAWLFLLVTPVSADQVWIEAAGAESTANGHRLSVTRSLGDFGLAGATAGFTHFRFGDSRWTLLQASANRRFGDKLIVDGALQIGPGHISETHFVYRKATLGVTVLLADQWSANLNDTYVNIDDTIGHVMSGSLTRSFSTGSSVTFNLIRSASASIDTRQFGAKFNVQRNARFIGGVYAGRTKNPVILNEFGADFGGESVATRQAYVGIGKAVGRMNVMAVFDYLRLGDVNRRELSLLLQMPIGSDRGGKR